MPSCRAARHTVMVLACVALIAVSTGCRSPFQRPAYGTAPESSSDGAHAGIPQLQPAPETGPGMMVPPVSEIAPRPESLSEPVASVPTPLLDAALKHAEAVDQVHRAANAAREQPSSSTAPGQPEANGKNVIAGATKSTNDHKEPVRSFKLPADSTVSPPADKAAKAESDSKVPPVHAQVVDWLTSEAAKPANQALFRRAVNTITDAVKNSAKDDSARSADIRSAVLALEDRAPLGVSNLRLCQKVSGFGSFEPLPAVALKGGQSVLVYCELTGLRYQARDTSYVSRLSSRVELIAARDGTKVWEQSLGEAEDQCRSRRHDNYANYRITLPPTLPTGDYRLRLTQNDLVANRSASSELSLSITR